LSFATGYEWQASRSSSHSLSDGAEGGLGNFTTETSASYAVRDSAYEAAGSYCFRLAHPDASPNLPPDEVLMLNQEFVPRTNGTLTLKSRLGYAADGETARVQVSTDGGVGWEDIYTQWGVGDGTSGPVDGGYSTKAASLAGFAGRPVRLRFVYTYTPGLFYIYIQPGFPIGWYLDDIVIANAEVRTVVASSTTATTNFTFNPPQATNYNLNVRGIMYGEFPLDWGPTKTVSATTNVPVVPPVIVMGRPTVTNGQVQLAFTLTTGASASFKLLQADQVSGPWTTNASATLTTNVPGSSYRFTTATGPAMRFYRVKAP